jgi:hypothetical protein
MSTALHKALANVGYKPTKRKQITFEKVIETLIHPITKPRKPQKVEVSRAGTHYKARYAGHATFCFGRTPEEAAQRLKLIQSNYRKPCMG